MNVFRRFLSSEHAATMVEYSVMASMIAAVAYAVVWAVGLKVEGTFTSAQSGW